MSGRDERIAALRARNAGLREQIEHKLERGADKAANLLAREALQVGRWELEEGRAADKAGDAIGLAWANKDIRDSDREADFLDYARRSDLDYQVGRRQGFDKHALDSLALENRITEARHEERAERRRTLLAAVVGHLEAEHGHRRRLEEMCKAAWHSLEAADRAQSHKAADDRRTHATASLQADQAHAHRTAEAAAASRHRTDEHLAIGLIDMALARLRGGGREVLGHSPEDVEALIRALEEEGDRLKRG